MSAGRGLPVHVYTADWSTVSNAMWQDCARHSTWVGKSVPSPEQPVPERGPGALAIHANGCEGAASLWLARAPRDATSAPTPPPTSPHEAPRPPRLFLLARRPRRGAARTCRMLSERRMSPLPSCTTASRPPGPSFILAQGRGSGPGAAQATATAGAADWTGRVPAPDNPSRPLRPGTPAGPFVQEPQQAPSSKNPSSPLRPRTPAAPFVLGPEQPATHFSMSATYCNRSRTNCGLRGANLWWRWRR